MNLCKLSPIFLLVSSTFTSLIMTALPSFATCTMTDVSLQISVHGSPTPTLQTNDVSMESSDNCWGNNSSNVSTQLYVGSGAAIQQRRSDHFVGNDNNSSVAPLGFSSPPIGTQISVPIDVYSPAHDPNLMNSLGLPFQP